MDREQMIRNLMALTERERAAHYAYANHLESRDALLTHADTIRGYFSAEDSYRKFVEGFQEEYSYMLASMNFPKGQRMGLFIHPRFSNNPMHSHDYCEVKYVLNGRARLIAGGRSFALEAGNLYIIAPNCPHQTFVFDRDTLIVNAEFDAGAAEKLFPRLFRTPNVIGSFLSPHASGERQVMCFAQVPEPAVSERMVNALYAEKDSARSPFALALCESYIEQVFLLLLDTQPDIYKMNVSQSKMQDISELLAYISKNLADIRFADLAQEFHYNESYLSGYIKKYTGHSFQSIVRAYRLDEAARLLSATDAPVDQIMRQVGYSGKTHFYQVFQERFGKTPAEYRSGIR